MEPYKGKKPPIAFVKKVLTEKRDTDEARLLKDIEPAWVDSFPIVHVVLVP